MHKLIDILVVVISCEAPGIVQLRVFGSLENEYTNVARSVSTVRTSAPT